MSKVVIFVHGLGANENEWWGSTKETLEMEQLSYEIDFFSYETSKFNNFKTYASIQDIGKNFSEYISLNYDSYSEIKIFGHSMGGIITSIAINSLYKKDKEKYSKTIIGLAYCGSPLGGALIVKRLLCLLFL